MRIFGGIQRERGQEILGLFLLGLTALLFLSLLTDEYQDQARRPLTNMGDAPNLLGTPGAITAGVLFLLLGHSAHMLYIVTGVWGGMLLTHRSLDRIPTRLLGLFLLAGAISGLLHVNLTSPDGIAFPGGTLGAFVAHLIRPHFGVIGASIILATVAMVGVLLSTEFLFAHFLIFLYSASRVAVRATVEVVRGLTTLLLAQRAERAAASQKPKKTSPAKKLESEEIEPLKNKLLTAWADLVARKKKDLRRINVRPEEQGAIDVVAEPAAAEAPAQQMEITEEPPKAQAKEKKPSLRRKKKEPEIRAIPPDYEYPKRYTAPPMSLLDKPVKRNTGDISGSLRKTSLLLEETLETFGIEAQVTDVTRGPTVTRFEVEPAPGVKVSRFVALADDFALALKAHRVRVEAPIPGKGRVGVEVPNAECEPVIARELLESQEFRKHGGTLPLAFGKDIGGDVVVADLATMPHLLVAGATGAGKTIFVKTILASLLFKHHPDELQLIMIDPKMVELSIFNDIPHLITPVVIDPKKAAATLNWLLSEMEERYRLFAELGMRNIERYNDSVENGEIEMDGHEGENGDSMAAIRKLPYIVCIIDELADLMMLARSDVENAIARLAQLARAVGIHLVIATQRPSVDVLTGVIKANLPARVSFQVSSRVDSRCILDEIGAERLIGRGDMLYLPSGHPKPWRLQGAFISDHEVNSLIHYLKTQAPPQYRDEIENFGKSKEGLDDLSNEDDELFDEAVRVVLDTGQASISMIQRRLRVGYTRAARLIDMMEMKGIVGPHEGSKAREILIDTPPPNDEVA